MGINGWLIVVFDLQPPPQGMRNGIAAACTAIFLYLPLPAWASSPAESPPSCLHPQPSAHRVADQAIVGVPDR